MSNNVPKATSECIPGTPGHEHCCTLRYEPPQAHDEVCLVGATGDCTCADFRANEKHRALREHCEKWFVDCHDSTCPVVGGNGECQRCEYVAIRDAGLTPHGA
jgi:hypothetical protein